MNNWQTHKCRTVNLWNPSALFLHIVLHGRLVVMNINKSDKGRDEKQLFELLRLLGEWCDSR